MADIKDFIRKQTTGSVTIGVPKPKPDTTTEQSIQNTAPVHETIEVIQEENTPKNHIGRPKSNVEKTKLSVYVPVEAKAKLIRIQHENYRQNLNDVLLEAVRDLLKKYDLLD